MKNQTKSLFFAQLGLSIFSVLHLFPYSTAQAQYSPVAHSPGTFQDRVTFGNSSREIQLELSGCTQSNNSINCSLMLTSLGSDVQVPLLVNAVRFLDFSGNEYYSSAGKIGSQTASERLSARYNTIQNVPVALSVRFDQVNSDIQSMAALEFDFRYLGTARFKDIPVQR